MLIKKKLNTCPTEDQEQTKLVTWLEKNNIDFFAIPNGGKRNLMEAYKLKRTGVKSGVPDICIPVPSTYVLGNERKWLHGLYIELKRVKGSATSDNQIYWIDKLRKNGYAAEICKGADHAKEVVLSYLNNYNNDLLS
jgi:hypothetical protein